MFLRTGAFFSSILSEFLKNLVALHQDRDDCLRVRKLVHECLTEREEEVITSRYGLGGKMPRTQREVAKKLGISRSYVSRIEKRALQKLEEAMGERE